MRVLLTGASGFIGSHLLTELLSLKVPVAVILRPESKPWRIQTHLDQIVRIYGDLTEKNLLLPEISRFSPTVLINLAWYGVENSYCNHNEQIARNLTAMHSLFDLAKEI